MIKLPRKHGHGKKLSTFVDTPQAWLRVCPWGELTGAAWEVTKADWSLGSTDTAKSSMCLCWTPQTWLLTCVHGLLDKRITRIFKKQHAHKMSVVKMRMLSWISENIRNFEIRKEEIFLRIGMVPIDEQMRVSHLRWLFVYRGEQLMHQ